MCFAISLSFNSDFIYLCNSKFFCMILVLLSNNDSQGTPHKYRPNGFAPTSNYYGNRRPYSGGHQHPSFGDYYSGPYSGSYGHRNEFESLRPYGYDPEPDDYVIYERSLGKNQTQANEKSEAHENTEE